MLVEKNFFEIRSEIDYYGASYVVAKYCGLAKPMYSNLTDDWQHGWAPEYYNTNPCRVVPGNFCDNKDTRYFVARKDQQKYLKEHGYKNVFAIGMPIVYLDAKTIERKKNSLLVMPVHSLHYTDHDHWGFKKYAAQIYSLKDLFNEIVICIHPACIKNNYWINEFSAYGFRIIEGASVHDKNALLRIQQMMSSFEYMTTNGFGSHLVYAAYFGVKVSIFGDFTEYRKEDFGNDPFYSSFPDILDISLNLCSEKTVRDKLPDFFVHPKEAVQKIEWAKEQLGEINKLLPKEIYDLFGWSQILMIQQSIYFPLIRVTQKGRSVLVSILPVSIRRMLKKLFKH